MKVDTLAPSVTPEIQEVEALREKFDELVNSETWGDSVEVLEEMTEPILKEIWALDDMNYSERLNQGEVDEVFSEAHEEKVEHLEEHLDEMTEVFMEKPYEAVVTDALHMFELNEGRSLSDIDEKTGTVTTTFVTRDASRTKADMQFSQERRADGSWEIQVEMPLRAGDFDGNQQKFVIVANSEKQLYVKQSVYQNYTHDTVEFHKRDAEKRHHWEDRLRRFFKDSLVAIGMGYERLPEERARVDKQALQMLKDKRKRDPYTKIAYSKEGHSESSNLQFTNFR